MKKFESGDGWKIAGAIAIFALFALMLVWLVTSAQAEITVTRHLSPNGDICLFIGDVGPARTSVCIERDDILSGNGWSGCWSVKYLPCIAIHPPRLGQSWYRAKECTTVDQSQPRTTCDPWVSEVRLSCFDATGMGCNPEIYHEEGQPEPTVRP